MSATLLLSCGQKERPFCLPQGRKNNFPICMTMLWTPQDYLANGLEDLAVLYALATMCLNKLFNLINKSKGSQLVILLTDVP